MAYRLYIYRFKNSIEYEYKFLGKYGAKGEKRAPKKKATKEQIARQNQINRENKTRRVLLLNFTKEDMWCCFKYPAGVRPSVDDMKEDARLFIRTVRKEYKKQGVPFKWYQRLEVGAGGGMHFHMVVNRIWDVPTDVILARCWKEVLDKKERGSPPERTEGLTDYKCIYEEGGFRKLAEYICKRPKEGSEEYEQLSIFDESEQRKLLYVSHSRNLEMPEPEVKTRSHWTVRKIVDEGPVPTPGYYIDKNSIYSGINPYNGYTTYRYTEYRLDRGGGSS